MKLRQHHIQSLIAGVIHSLIGFHGFFHFPDLFLGNLPLKAKQLVFPVMIFDMQQLLVFLADLILLPLLLPHKLNRFIFTLLLHIQKQDILDGQRQDAADDGVQRNCNGFPFIEILGNPPKPYPDHDNQKRQADNSAVYPLIAFMPRHKPPQGHQTDRINDHIHRDLYHQRAGNSCFHNRLCPGKMAKQHKSLKGDMLYCISGYAGGKQPPERKPEAQAHSQDCQAHDRQILDQRSHQAVKNLIVHRHEPDQERTSEKNSGQPQIKPFSFFRCEEKNQRPHQ